MMSRQARSAGILTVLAALFSHGSFTSAAAGLPAKSAQTLWYGQPAGDGMNEALPIGNGRLGGLIYGETFDDKIVFNEDSLWTGDKNPGGDYGKMGAYQKFGQFDIALDNQQSATGYVRSLDLSTALAKVEYTANGVHYLREYFASHPAQVLVARYLADKPGAYTGTISLAGAHGETTRLSGSTLEFDGNFDNGITYDAQLRAIFHGGSQSISNGVLSFSKCSSIELILGCGTNYVMDFSKGYHGADPQPRVSHQIENAASGSYDKLLQQHVADYQQLFGRTTISLGQTSSNRRALPTDARKILAAQGGDPELEALLFQYGRYLLISCSRPGSLPANLQGLWNDSNSPPWSSDYHTDINIQMNYWLAEPANLSECSLPLFDLADSQIPVWTESTMESPDYAVSGGAPGFDLRASHNIMGGMGWLWIPTADAWYLQQYWEHYAFTGDKTFLRQRAYPLIKQTCEFWRSRLRQEADGTLVVPNGWSPEHGQFEDGVSFDQELIWDLFSNDIDASKALNVDADYRATIESVRSKLLVPHIGRWGHLQEWMEDKDDPNDHHRHTSNLVGVFPGRQFSVLDTPQLIAAAKISLLHRGDQGDVTEWAYAWRASLFARMHDSERAHGQLLNFFAARNSCINLFGYCPPMQIDGNFGTTAAICEMLLQSQNGQIELLPALPAEWNTGKVTGLRARGGFIVDETWKNGILTSAKITSTIGAPCVVRYANKVVNLEIPKGEFRILKGRWLSL